MRAGGTPGQARPRRREAAGSAGAWRPRSDALTGRFPARGKRRLRDQLNNACPLICRPGDTPMYPDGRFRVPRPARRRRADGFANLILDLSLNSEGLGKTWAGKVVVYLFVSDFLLLHG